MATQLHHPSDYSKTPTPLPPVPRRMDRGKNDSILGPVMILGSIILIGLILGLYVGFGILWYEIGTRTSAKVNGVCTFHYVGKNRPHTGPGVRCSVTVGNVTYDGFEIPITDDEYEHFEQALQDTSKEPKINVLFFALGPFTRAGRPDTTYLILSCILAVPLVIWNGVSLILIYLTGVVYRRNQLFKYGQATTGVITSKRKQVDESAKGQRRMGKFWASVSFRTELSDEDVEFERTIPQSAWKKAVEGNSVTVIYDPAHPNRHEVVEWEQVKFADSSPDGTKIETSP